MTDDRIPPHDERSEAAVIGCLLLDDRAPGMLLPILREDAIYLAENRRIVEAIRAVHGGGIGVDAVTVSSELRSRGWFDAATTCGLLADSMDAVPVGGHPEEYVRRVNTDAQRREVLLRVARIAAGVYDGTPLEELNTAFREAADAAAPETTAAAPGTSLLARVRNPPRDLLTLPHEAYGNLGVFEGGHKIVVGARTSFGKTALCCSLAAGWADMGVVSHILSFEDTATEIEARVAAQVARVPFGRILRGRWDPADPDAINRVMLAAKRMDTHGPVVHYCSGWTAEEAADCIRAADRSGARVVIVDYIQAVGSDEASENRNQEIARILRLLTRAAAGRIVLVIASQLNRVAATDVVPEAHHLRDSGVLEQDAHAVLLLHWNGKPEVENGRKVRQPMEIIAAKNKNGERGKLNATFHFQFSCIAPGLSMPSYVLGGEKIGDEREVFGGEEEPDDPF